MLPPHSKGEQEAQIPNLPRQKFAMLLLLMKKSTFVVSAVKLRLKLKKNRHNLLRSSNKFVFYTFRLVFGAFSASTLQITPAILSGYVTNVHLSSVDVNWATGQYLEYPEIKFTSRPVNIQNNRRR